MRAPLLLISSFERLLCVLREYWRMWRVSQDKTVKHLLIGAVVAASGPDSTAAVPFSNLVVSIVGLLLALVRFYWFCCTRFTTTKCDTRWAVAASRTKREEMSNLESMRRTRPGEKKERNAFSGYILIN